MQINITANSWHAKVFRWYFDLSYSNSLPRTLCPYFWGWVLMIPTIPVFLVCGAPMYLFVWIDNAISKEKTPKGEGIAPATMAAISVLVTTPLFVTGSGVLFFFQFCLGHKTSQDHWISIGVGGLILLMVLGLQVHKRLHRRSIYNSYNLWYDRIGYKESLNSPADWDLWRERNRRTSFWQVVGEGIKSIYKKTCPIIHWH